MFISKFNKLIRNRLLWGIFAFIVIISFVAWGTQTGGRKSQEDTAGKLYGKPVSADKFRKEYFNTYLSMSLMFGQPLKITDKLNELMRKLTWRRMVVIQKAEEMKLNVPADEVTGTIEQQPLFIENGQFSRKKYEAFLQTFLAKMGASEAQFEDQVREELLINKARMFVSQSVWVVPFEIAQAFSLVYDTFEVSYTVLRADELNLKVRIKEADARKYFDAHRESFKIPELVRVKYAAFPFALFINEDGLTAETLRSYYDENIERFSLKTTNGWSNPTPFEDVEKEIRSQLAFDNAITTAGDKALDLEVSLAPDRAGNAPSFEAAVSTAGVTVATSAFFSLKEKIPGLNAGLDFNQAAFSLRPTADDYFSHPIRGSNAYYIVAFDQRKDARIPDFEEVKEQVFAAAKEEAAEENLNQLARYLHDKAAAAVKNGRSLGEALKSCGIEVITTEPFSAKSGFPDDDENIVYALTKNIMTYNAGELTDIIPLQDGVAIAWIKSRKSADNAVFQAIKNDLGMFIRRKRAETVYYEWQEYLLKKADFEDNLIRKSAGQLPEDEPENEPENEPDT